MSYSGLLLFSKLTPPSSSINTKLDLSSANHQSSVADLTSAALQLFYRRPPPISTHSLLSPLQPAITASSVSVDMENAKKKKYPQRLFKDGNYPSLPRSLNHGTSLEQLRLARKTLGEDAWKVMRESKLGCIAKLAEINFIFCGRTLFYFLTRQLDTKKVMEMWCLIGDDPLRFSFHEFAQITGMNCDPYGPRVEVVVDHTELWEKMGLAIGDGPHWKDMRRVLDICAGWTLPQRTVVGLLCLLHVGVFGYQRGQRIDFKYAKMDLDTAAFNSFQWGRLAFEVLMKSIKEANLAGSSVTLNGFVQAVSVWALESYPKLGDMFGRKKSDDELPLLRWGGSRCHYDVDDVVFAAKRDNAVVPVKNMVMKPMTDIYPDWPCEVDDDRVDTLIQDILNQCLRKNEWTWEWHERVSVDQKMVRRPNKKRSSVGPISKDEGAAPVGSKKKKVVVNEGGEDVGQTSSNTEVLTMLRSLSAKIDEMGNQNQQQLLAVNTRFEDLADQVGLMKGAISSLQNAAKVEAKKPLSHEGRGESCSSKIPARVDIHTNVEAGNSIPNSMAETDLIGEKDRKDSVSENLSWLERPTLEKKKPKLKKTSKKPVEKKIRKSEKAVKVKVEPVEKFVTPKNRGRQNKKGVKHVDEDEADDENTDFGNHLDLLATQLLKMKDKEDGGRVRVLAQTQQSPYP